VLGAAGKLRGSASERVTRGREGYGSPMFRLVLCALGCVACGGVMPAADRSTSACERAQSDAARAWAEAGDRAEEIGREGDTSPPTPVAVALDRLHEHARSLEAEPRELGGDEALAISSVLMDAVDATHGELPNGLRERADDAAEALLTDRSEQGAGRATRGAITVLEEIVRAVDPVAATTRETRLTLADFATRARDAASAYAESAAAGDRSAEHAESLALPPPAMEARDRAVELSSIVRSECGVARSVAAPSL
jgi:hypothetical protein